MDDREYRALLMDGRAQLDAAMVEARRRNEQTRTCNGREDCLSEHHLVCCLSVKPTA